MIFMKDIKTSHRSSLAEENRLRVTAVQASYQAAVLSHVASMCDTHMGCPRDHLRVVRRIRRTELPPAPSLGRFNVIWRFWSLGRA